MHDQTPVAELVAEPFDDQLLVVGDDLGGLLLLLDQRHEVLRGPLVEPGGVDPLDALLVGHRGDLAGERADRGTELAAGRGCRRSRTGGVPAGGGETSTRSWVMSSMRQLVVPSVNTSPTRDS